MRKCMTEDCDKEAMFHCHADGDLCKECYYETRYLRGDICEKCEEVLPDVVGKRRACGTVLCDFCYSEHIYPPTDCEICTEEERRQEQFAGGDYMYDCWREDGG